MSSHRDPNLTSAIRNRRSLLRRFLDQHFGDVRPLQADYRRRASTLLVPGGSADPAAIGAAFDFGVRFALDADYVPEIAYYGFAGLPPCLDAIARVVEVAQQAPPASAEFASACWALALTTSVYREGGVPPDSPLVPLLRTQRFTADTLLRLASPDARRQLQKLAAIAGERLLPELLPPYDLGTTFATSRLMPADADLIAGGLLLDLKTRLGRRDPRTHARTDSLPRTDIYQLVAYALFDRTDDHHIDAIGIYSARYGSLVRWPLADALATLAGEPVDLPAARDAVWRLLST
ncbi:hypothetical protein HJ588_17490 [Flexivirga sp. ID2601S]|uniref:Uncharacterized protein n=1 Tax=Flexivirga aerilata TaxID=1656889 RepID=A0A849AKW6_9MICO|nr:hypothetical protein [Flexivirga aerilata]NNG41055.1 hypothetical protein [Flexivirga aerilata]